MPQIDLKRRAMKFIKTLPPKHRRQVKDYILSLQTIPMPKDARTLKGYEKYIRADVGEYRIIYRYDNKKELITVILVGKRNDGEIYKIARRVLD